MEVFHINGDLHNNELANLLLVDDPEDFDGSCEAAQCRRMADSVYLGRAFCIDHLPIL